MNRYIAIVLFSALLVAFSQILLKKSALKTYSSWMGDYFNIYVISAYFILFITVFLNIIAYKGIDLKEGPVIASASYIFVLILGRIFLNEKITKMKVFGNILIILGIIVFSM